jgi:uncharacterized protein YndB with AHSA1/START domain
MNTQIVVEPVRKSITVASPVDRAFATFTEGIESWWPADTHSVGAYDDQVETEEIVFVGGEDGRLYERLSDGRECNWGEILVWEPPSRIVLTWHPGYDDPAEFTELELRFSPDGELTRVDLEHRGWERLGDRARETREGYREGWDFVLRRFEEGGAA